MRKVPTVADVLGMLKGVISGDTLFGMLTRFWDRRPGRGRSAQMLVLLDRDEMIVIRTDETGHLVVETYRPSDTLGRLGREVQDEINEGLLP